MEISSRKKHFEEKFEITIEENYELIQIIFDSLLEKNMISKKAVSHHRNAALSTIPISYEELDQLSYYDDHTLYEKTLDPLQEKQCSYLIKEILQKKLNEKEFYIITHSFGLSGNRPKSLQELADELGNSYQCISKTKIRALEKLTTCQPLKLFYEHNYDEYHDDSINNPKTKRKNR